MPNRVLPKPESNTTLTSREVADIMGLSVTTAQNLLESGVLPSWKTPGGHRRVLRTDVLNLLASYSAPKEGDAPRAEGDMEQPHYPKADNDAARIKALKRTGLLNTPDEAFERITWLAQEILDVPISLITLLNEDQQWFKSKEGTQLEHTPRDWAFCNYTILKDEVFVVEDAHKDPRFNSNPLVLASPHIRFYAGVPIGGDEFTYGALCVLDQEPRILRNHEREALLKLGQMANDLISLRAFQKQNQSNKKRRK